MPPRMLRAFVQLLVAVILAVQPVVMSAAPVARAVTLASASLRPTLQSDPELPPDEEPGAEPVIYPMPVADDPADPDAPPQQVPLDGLFGDDPRVDELPGPALLGTPALPPTPVDLVVELDRYVLAVGEAALLTVRADRVADTPPIEVSVQMTLPAELAIVGTLPPLAWTLAAGETSLVYTATVTVSAVATATLPLVTEIGLVATAAEHAPWHVRWVVGIAPDVAAAATEAVVAQQSGGAVLQAGALSLLAPAAAVAPATQIRYTALLTATTPLPAEPLPAAGDHVLRLPLLDSGAGTAELVVASNPDVPTVEEGGVSFYRVWQLATDATAVATDAHPVFATPVLMVVDVADLVAQGVEMGLVQLWTRPDATQDWRPLPARYDEKRRAWVAWLEHFSDFGLGIAPSAAGELLPSLKAATSDRHTGGASFRLPIRTPSGPGGLNPGLSLNYSSVTVDSVFLALGHSNNRKIQANTVGYGWNLGGLSYITKFRDNLDRVYYTLVLNGQSYDIKEIAGQPGVFDTDPISFAAIKFTQNAATSLWQIKTTDGILYEFGGTLPSLSWPTSTGERADLIEMRFYVDGSTKVREAVSWYLRDVKDTVGNTLDYSYLARRGTVLSSDCMPSGLPADQQWYTRDVRLDNVTWGGNSGAGLPARLRAQMVYASRNDTAIVDGCQPRWGGTRLSEVQVQVSDQGPADWATIRSYTLAHTYATGSKPEYLRHLLLASVTEKGRSGGVLTTHTFGYTPRVSGENNDTENNIQLTSLANGYGGVVTYTYSDAAQECTGGDVTCGNLKRRLVTRTQVADGRGNYNLTDHAYNKPFVWVNDGRLVYLGIDYATSTVYAPTTNPGGTLSVVRFEEYWFHRGSLNQPDARHGKPLKTTIRDRAGTGNILYSATGYKWETYDRTPSGWTSANIAGDEPVWIRLERQDDWVEGSGRMQVFAYDTGSQGGQQYGNVTSVEERSHPEAVLDYTTWTARVTNNQVPLLRRTETTYYPNTGWPASSTAAYIVDRPARVLVEDGSGACAAEARTVYIDYNAAAQNRDGAYNVAPQTTLVAKTAQVVSGCPWADTATNRWATNLVVQSFAYDPYGNATARSQHGDASAQDVTIQTVYDAYYHSFPVRQYYSQDTTVEETAEYYGVNTTAPVSAQSFWGEAAKACGANDVCSFYTYDEFGRLVHQWDNLPATTANWPADAAATVRWGYRKPGELGAEQKTYIVTAWRAPRCYGNLVRRHYDGLGQLVIEQQSYQNWQGSVDGCSVTSQGHEIVTEYAYDALGNQVRATVPRLYDRLAGGYLYYAPPANWSSQTQTAYNPLGRPVRTTAPNGEQTDFVVNGRAGSAIAVGRNGDTSRTLRWQQTDGLGQLSQVQQQQWTGSAWSTVTDIDLTHSVIGNLTRADHGTLGISTYTYDQAGRMTQMADIDLGSWSYGYDRLNRPTRQVDAAGRATCLFYDAIGRLSSKSFGPSASSCATLGATKHEEYAYGTAAGNRNRLTNLILRDRLASNSQYLSHAWSYNTQGLLTGETVNYPSLGQYTAAYAYDAYQRLEYITYPDNEQVRHYYNGMGRISQLYSTVHGVLVDSLSYDVVGRLTALRDTVGTDLYRTQTYYPWNQNSNNSNARLQDIKVGTSAGSTNKLWLTYSYDSAGNVTQIKEGYNGAAQTAYAFTYDLQNRLATGYGQSYSFLGSGRMSAYEGKSYAYHNGGDHPYAVREVAGSGYTRYFNYDAAGNMTQRQVRNGSTTTTQTLGWDWGGRLRSVTQSGVATETYRYDPQGIRVRKTVGTVETLYPFPFYEIEGGVVTRSYLLDGQRVALRIGTGAITYLHADQVGSVVMSTQGSTITASRQYRAYGLKRGGDEYAFEPNYTGQRLDTTGLLYYNARYYDPQLGVFISPDSLIPDPTHYPAYHRYLYADGNPLKYNDPTGHYFNPGCPFCDAEWFDYSGTSGIVNRFLDTVATVGCLALVPCNVNTQEDVVTGPTRAEYADYLANSAIGMGLTPISTVALPDAAAGRIATTLERGFKPFAGANFRKNLETLTEVDGLDLTRMDAHHLLPQKFGEQFEAAGLNIHDPHFGSWVEHSEHVKWSYQYNREWEEFLGQQTEVPTQEAILDFAENLAKEYGFDVHFSAP